MDEDDARTSNIRIAHSTMKNNRNVIECCNNTHQGAPHTDKQTSACASDLGDATDVICFACNHGLRDAVFSDIIEL